MNLSQLQYFKVLAQEEHYTRAAQMYDSMPAAIDLLNALHTLIKHL